MWYVRPKVEGVTRIRVPPQVATKVVLVLVFWLQPLAKAL
jgi:hypothetical protein